MIQPGAAISSIGSYAVCDTISYCCENIRPFLRRIYHCQRVSIRLFINYFNILAYFIGAKWTASGGRRQIESKQLRNLRRLVEKSRKDSPLFQRMYAGLPESSVIGLKDLPVTRKPELMRDFNDWLTVRTLTLRQARAHIADMKNLAVPIEGVVLFRTSGASGEPAIIALPPSHFEYAFGVFFARMEKKT